MTEDRLEAEGRGKSLKRSSALFHPPSYPTEKALSYEISTDASYDATGEEELIESEEEDHERREYVEDHEYIISGVTPKTVNIQFSLTEDGIFDPNWKTTFIAECTYHDVTVGTAVAEFIHRESIRSHFWEEMEVPSRDMCVVASEVFDRYRALKTKYKQHPVQRGTGVWGDELDHGPLSIIEYIHIKAPKLRRRGLGQKMVSLLLGKAKRLNQGQTRDNPYELNEHAFVLHAVVRPGYLTADVGRQLVDKSKEELLIKAQAYDGATQFLQTCGFRRIGASSCFAFSFDPQHQSRALSLASDFYPRREHLDDLERDETVGSSSWPKLEELRMQKLRALPLHHAALNLDDHELEAFFAAYDATEFKPQSTKWLLENIVNSSSWRAARDVDGYTPLEALKEKLETIRTKKEHGTRIISMSDHFMGVLSSIVFMATTPTKETESVLKHDDEEFPVEGNTFANLKALQRYDGTESDEDDTDREELVWIKRYQEEHEHAVSEDEGTTVKVTLFMTRGPSGVRWMRDFHVECTQDDEKVGHAFGILVYRKFTLQRGTGVWQDELDNGPLFLIETVQVTSPVLRRKGLGSKMVALLLAKVQKYIGAQVSSETLCNMLDDSKKQLSFATTLHALAMPERFEETDPFDPLWKFNRRRRRLGPRRLTSRDGAVAFFRSCDFRRVGASDTFAYSFNANHPSRTVASTADFDLPSSPPIAYDNFVGPPSGKTVYFNRNQHYLSKIKETLPFHYAAEAMDDDECMRFFKDYAKWNWTKPNGQIGSYHFAYQNVPEVQAWKYVRNLEGYTPLDALRDQLEGIRTGDPGCRWVKLHLFEYKLFEEFRSKASQCLRLLSMLTEGQCSMSLLDSEQLKYGCTCGECIAGVISPRMAFALTRESRLLSVGLRDSKDNSNIESRVFHRKRAFYRLTRAAKKKFQSDPTMRDGYANVYDFAVRCLEARVLPGVQTMLENLDAEPQRASDTEHYLQSMGRERGIRVALLHMLESAELEDERAGYGTAQLWTVDAWLKLKKCRNDHEFEFISPMLGVSTQDTYEW
ncbi:hypothetical protein HK57_00243 [Aspergillus ustus]|uniref:N-acetyltransferase domain-containing protein n=1 Tax=Aspergillus ustus TaxID=40382 RepID=A0A0C1C4B6_ASPUT|nr:hypothetical protein HK57_00243 [Aspergillus ustus]